jgi:hypothetical protein
MEREEKTPERVRIIVRRQRVKKPPAAQIAGPVVGAERFAAEFAGGLHHGKFVKNCSSPEEAVGALIRQVVESLASADETMTFLAGLFGDLSVRSANVILARAVWIAAKHPARKNRGILLDNSAVGSIQQYSSRA